MINVNKNCQPLKTNKCLCGTHSTQGVGFQPRRPQLILLTICYFTVPL